MSLTIYGLRDSAGVEVFRGTIDPPPGGGSVPDLAAVLAEGGDRGGGAITNVDSVTTGSVDASGGSVGAATVNADNVLVASGAVGIDSTGIVLEPGTSVGVGDVVLSDTAFNMFGGTITTMGGSGLGTARFKGAIGANGVAPNTPEIPATPTEQDIVDALLALGLVTQAAP